MAAVLAAGFAAAPAIAATLPAIDVPPGRLSTAITALGRQANIDILFSSDLVGDRQSAGVRGRVAPADALARLLAGSGLVFRKTGDNAFVIARAPELAVGAAPADDTIPEILVIGRRAQNSDIRRSQDDIQPYQVYTRREIQRSGSNSIDEFARTRLSANAQIAAPAQLGSDTRSEINLRGLGANQTLVLIDGRRLPNPPNGLFAFNQPDLNALPIEMIDRIEVLTATAGGIYGTGATSGAVNVILKRDYRGAEVSATTGITSRGDAFTYRLFGRLGFTPDHGRTDVMLAVGRSREATLEVSERDYGERALKRRYANAPDAVLASAPVGNGINIVGFAPLVLDAALGGAALGSTFTSLPLDLGADPDRKKALLLANAGTLALDRAPDNRRISVVTPPVTRSVFLNVRHDFGGGIEATVDLIDTRNSGRQRAQSRLSPGYVLTADLPVNPFQQSIAISFPNAYSASTINRTVNAMQRVTAGLIVPLPGRWRANAEFGQGRASVSQSTAQTSLSSDFYNALFFGRSYPGRPPLDPLGDWAQFQAALAAYASTNSSTLHQTDRYNTYSLRLAGPVVRLAGGPATLTLLAQQRRESVAATRFLYDFGGQPLALNVPRVAQQVRSLYGEARLPLTRDAGLLSNLDVQLALRQDWTRSTLPGAATFVEMDPPAFAKTNGTTLYTVGARFEPLPSVMLRASLATGALPPATSQIGSRQFPVSGVQDPKRGRRLIGTETAAILRSGGNPDLRPERARSISVGAVVTPGGINGPRLSIDFTRITKHDEIVPFQFASVQSLIANEADYPERVTRAALTDADRALGFTAGPVTRVDLTSINFGKTRIDSLDLAANQDFELGEVGAFEAYLRATWEPNFRQRLNQTAPWIQRVGYRDGPLRWRGNAGLDWTRGRLTLGVNAQFYSRYRVTTSNSNAAAAAQQVLEQGSPHIPAQVYADFSGIIRLSPVTRRDAAGPEVRWAILNIFDHRPPTVVDPLGSGYSYYGDPRRRRVQLTLSVPLF